MTSCGSSEREHASDGTPVFERQLEDLMPAMRRYALRLTRADDRADDLVQDAVIKALVAKDQYTDGSNLKAWVRTIIRNTFLSSIRREKFQGTYHAAMAERLTTRPRQLDHLTNLELQQALLRLPEQQRQSLVMVVIEGYSYADAATACGCMIGTIKSRIGRAREKLHRALSDDPGSVG